MHLRRMTRLTSGFSRKLSSHRPAVSLHIGWYNLVRIHESLRVTPAMALGVTDHVWSIRVGDDGARRSRPVAARDAGPTVVEGHECGTGERRRTGSYRRPRRPRLRMIKGGFA
jgi:hypothetical protein